MCINLRTGAVYVGQTRQSPIQRLRKHHTDARAAADCATFHRLLLTTRLSDWVTIPVQYCESLFQAGLVERNWWSDLKHWAVNDIPPGISENDTSNTKRAYITSTVLHVLQQLRQAKQERDTPRVKALQVFLRDTAQQLALPFHLCGTIVVSNLTKLQKTVITNIVRKIVHVSPLKAYERQALKHSVRIVRSNPHTVRSLFQTHAVRQTRRMERPPCRCHEFSARAPEFGKVLHIDGHAALLPAVFAVGGHENLRPNDPVPVPGRRARAQAVSGITDFCKHLQTAVPSLDTLLPMSLFPESGNLLAQLGRLSKFLSRSQHVRIVDKGAGEMWGFCAAWLWDQVEEFMRKENFTPAGCTVDQWNTKIARVVKDMNLQRNPKGRLCILYVLAKAKSLRTGKWVFRGISASPVPVLNGQQLRLAARSFTCMLRLLQTEITHNFQCADIKQVAGWFRFISQKGALSLTEMDCKKQFDNIQPRAVLKSFKEASNWIYKKRRWRQVNLQWSVSKESAKLDRTGQATNTRFWCITHDLLSRLLKFELTENSMLQAVGTLWKREGSIPMGGPFSAQSADLHTPWRVKRAGKKLRNWGELNISDEGYIYWQRGPLWFSLCQFRDNILFASNHRPGAHTSIIQTVTETLSSVLDLEVLCPCTDGGKDCCVGNCLT